jgi:hypothetical protein
MAEMNMMQTIKKADATERARRAHAYRELRQTNPAVDNRR